MKLNRTQIITFSSLLILIAIIIFIVLNRSRKKKEIKQLIAFLDGEISSPTEAKEETQAQKTLYTSLPEGTFPLKLGQQSKRVYELQKNLNRVYNASLTKDGKFGAAVHDVICDKYWNYCTVATFGFPPYKARELTQSEFDEIKNM